MSKREWVSMYNFEEIKLEKWNHIAKLTINRPRYYNAFTPTTTTEMSVAMDMVKEDQDIYTIILTGEGDKAFCAGGDQNVKGKGGYIGKDGVPNPLNAQTRYCNGKWLCNWWRTRTSCSLRFNNSQR